MLLIRKVAAVLLFASLSTRADEDAEQLAIENLMNPEFEDGSNMTTISQGLHVTSLMLEDRDEASKGRQLTEAAKKPKRKYCNTSAYGLKGDYAYEACGAFCKQAKAVNHCKFCKCRACSFCANIPTTPLNKMMKKATVTTSVGIVPAANEAKKAKKAMRTLKGGGKGKGKGLGKKKRMKME